MMIVRISGLGQFELDDAAVRKLDEFDTKLTDTLKNASEQEFHDTLCSAINFVQETGRTVEPTRIVPSDVIIPPEDVTLAEAKQFFTDEGLMEPLPARSPAPPWGSPTSETTSSNRPLS